jgi:hypothetical protein
MNSSLLLKATRHQAPRLCDRVHIAATLAGDRLCERVRTPNLAVVGLEHDENAASDSLRLLDDDAETGACVLSSS